MDLPFAFGLANIWDILLAKQSNKKSYFQLKSKLSHEFANNESIQFSFRTASEFACCTFTVWTVLVDVVVSCSDMSGS